MFLKLMGSLPSLLYATDAESVYVNQFVGSRASLELKSGTVHLTQATHYPWGGAISIRVEPERPAEFALFLRLPAWCKEPRLSLNSQSLPTIQKVRGYACLRRTWRSGDSVDLSLPMPVQRVEADPHVRANSGRVAIQRGPVVYCFEEDDNGEHVEDLVISPEARLVSEFRPNLLGGVAVIRGKAQVAHPPRTGVSAPVLKETDETAVPYFANGNRQPGRMLVWMAGSPDRARRPSLASHGKPSASHCNPTDTLAALNDQPESPNASDDTSLRRFTWWDHRGTREWVQYDFPVPTKISAAEVYWWDERRIRAHCRVPASWRLLYLATDGWQPVRDPSDYGLVMDRFNRVTFEPVETKSLRIEVQLQPGWSGGILEWRVE
jgi:hypothetical protein